MIATTAAALVARVATAGNQWTVDEFLWLHRSRTFSDALVDLAPSQATIPDLNPFGGTTATRPGVTTMWLGSGGRVVWRLGADLGLWQEGSPTFELSRTGLAVTQTILAVAISLLIGLATALLARWIGRLAGLTAGLLLATEPFWVAHGAVVHTDALTALFGLCGLVALALALGVPRPDDWSPPRRRAAVLAGALLACACLTKVVGAVFAPSALFVAGWAAVASLRRRDPGSSAWAALRTPAIATATAAGAAVATALVLWPALWVDPVHQLDLVHRSATDIGYSDVPVPRLFLGEVSRHGSPWFYLVVLPFRMTPWMQVATVVAVPLALIRRSSRGFAVVLAAGALPAFVTLSTAPAQAGRYGLLVLAPLCAVVGVGIWPPGRASLGPVTSRQAHRLLLGAGALATVHALVVAPWGTAYYNPLLGGGPTAVKRVPVGWQQGMGTVSARVQELEDGDCDGITVYGPSLFDPLWECGDWAHDPSEADYVVVPIEERQRTPPGQLEAMTAGRELVSTVVIRGITWAEIWH